MSLQRENILQRCRELLLHRTDAADHVTVNRVEVEQLEDLPSIAIYGLSESVGQFVEQSPRRFVRVLKVAVEIKIADPSSAAASQGMNALAEQVERILLRDPNLRDAAGDPLANDVRWAGMELLIDPNSRQIVAGLAVQLEVDYVYEPEELAPADVRDLLGVDVSIESPDGSTTAEVADDVTLPGP